MKVKLELYTPEDNSAINELAKNMKVKLSFEEEEGFSEDITKKGNPNSLAIPSITKTEEVGELSPIWEVSKTPYPETLAAQSSFLFNGLNTPRPADIKEVREFNVMREDLRHILTPLGLNENSDKEDIRAALFESLLQTMDIGRLGLRVLLALIVEACRQYRQIGTDSENHILRDLTLGEKIREEMKNLHLPITEEWLPIFIEEIPFADYIFSGNTTSKYTQVRRNSKQWKSLYSPELKRDSQKNLVKRKIGDKEIETQEKVGVLHNLHELGYVTIVEGGGGKTLTKVQLFRMSPPIMRKSNIHKDAEVRGYFIELSPQFFSLSASQFALMKPEDLAFLFQTDAKEITLRLYTYLVQNRLRKHGAKVHYPKFYVSQAELKNKVGKSKTYSINPNRYAEDLAESFDIMKELGLITESNMSEIYQIKVTQPKTKKRSKKSETEEEERPKNSYKFVKHKDKKKEVYCHFNDSHFSKPQELTEAPKDDAKS